MQYIHTATSPAWRNAFICCAAMISAGVSVAGEEVEFDKSLIYLELNSSDQDLGIHSKVDGEAWKRARIRAPNHRSLLNVWARGGLRRQGLTELFFESDEPEIPGESDVETILRRASEGTYIFSGRTLSNDRIEGEWDLSHVVAAPAEAEVSVGGGGWECSDVSSPPAGDVTFQWEEITTAYDDDDVDPDGLLGDGAVLTGDDEVVLYTLVVERDENEDAGLPTLVYSVDLPPGAAAGGTFSVTVPAAFFSLGGEYKYETIVRTAAHNQTTVEECITEAEEEE